jgi:SAM-dependent methyltransferase
MRTEYSDPVRGARIARFLSEIKGLKKAKVLDIGCNNGAISMAIAEFAGQVVSGEIEKYRIKNFLKRKVPKNIGIIRMNGLELPFKDGKFDIAIVNGVMEHVPTHSNENPKAVQIRFLRGVRRALKKNGIIYIGIENRFSIKYLMGARSHNGMRFIDFLPRAIADAYSRSFRGKAFRHYTHGINAYRKMLVDSGFSDIKFHIAIPNYQFPLFIADADDKRLLMECIRKGVDKRTYRIGAKVMVKSGLQKRLSPNFVIVAKK